MAAERSKTILDLLAARFPTAKRTTLRNMIRDGRVVVGDEAIRSASQVVAEDADLQVRDRPRAKPPVARPLPFEIVYEDADLVVIDKPHGLITASGARDRRPTLLRLLQSAMKGRSKIHLVHRLDADAAGLIVFSRSSQAHAALKKQFADHSAERVYVAHVHGVPSPAEGKIASRLVELADGRVRSTGAPGRGETAVSRYRKISSAGGKSVMRIWLETGRKHQIRVHLAERGWPIVNDPLYNPRRAEGPLRLVAMELAITHPRTGQRVTFQRELPEWAAG